MRQAAQQALEQADPAVRGWLEACGLAVEPVHIRLTGKSEKDVLLQVDRMRLVYGPFLKMGRPSANESETAWIAYGTIVG